MTETLWLLIEPADVWLFRDARPFSPAEGGFAQSRFPPLPATVAGALRTYIGHALYDGSFANLGTADTSPIRFLGPLIVENPDSPTVYVPAPADLLRPPDRKDAAVRLEPRSWPNWVDAAPQPPSSVLFWTAYLDKAEPLTGWITWADFWAWQNGKTLSSAVIRRASDFYEFEARPGIRMDSSRNVVHPQGGAFYWVNYVRLRLGIALLVGLQRWTWPESEWSKLVEHFQSTPEATLRLGGERRLAFLRRAPESVTEELARLAKVVVASDSLGLWLLTPAVVEDPSQIPFYIGPRDAPSTARIQALVRASGPSVHVGWDYVRNAPKPPRRLLPAGSVLVLQADQPISGTGWMAVGDMPTLGYGWAVPFPFATPSPH
ncbi:MAG: hypothetical protein NZ742_05915 [Acidobacteria bacterium]|nr:hypothetical protein [Acidobacteriota bacterium]MDW7984895.1 type III-B CRISPR module-associated Cmr3 family protein [Acidobacteriota bacterium]